MQSGTAAVTILAGTAVGTAAVIFPTSFASLPDVVVSCDSGLYIAGKNSLSDTGFIATITARFAQPSNVSDVVTWIARLP
jgi:hypothetical protein